MKFFHVGDLHFGKVLHNVPLVEKDQPFWVEQFLKAVDEYQPDAVVIAGDVYDRKVPSPEAMQLFDHLLTELARREKYVFVIPGNHDSPVRLAHVNELLTQQKIFIAGALQRELIHVTVPGEETDVTFWLMPYIFPKLVSDKRVLDREDLSTYDEAVRALLAAQDIDENSCNVLAAHQNVLSNGVPPEHSESETIIGGMGEIECSAFDAFDYVALGHIHNEQRVGRETVRYSGCPLFYDFSEINRKKELMMITVHSKDRIEREMIKIPILHRLKQFSGTLNELLEEGKALEDKDSYYVQCILSGQVPSRAMEQLRDVYGDCLIHIKRSLSEKAPSEEEAVQKQEMASMSLEEQFVTFFMNQQGEWLDEIQEELVRRIIEQQTRQGENCFLDVKSIPEEDSSELLEFLMSAAKEDENETA